MMTPIDTLRTRLDLMAKQAADLDSMPSTEAEKRDNQARAERLRQAVEEHMQAIEVLERAQDA
jgi:hypothetical protein